MSHSLSGWSHRSPVKQAWGNMARGRGHWPPSSFLSLLGHGAAALSSSGPHLLPSIGEAMPTGGAFEPRVCPSLPARGGSTWLQRSSAGVVAHEAPPKAASWLPFSLLADRENPNANPAKASSQQDTPTKALSLGQSATSTCEARPTGHNLPGFSPRPGVRSGYMQSCTHTHAATRVHTCAYKYTQTCAHRHTHCHAHMCAHTPACTQTHTPTYAHSCVHTGTHTTMHTCM